jgi:hypothetical protein
LADWAPAPNRPNLLPRPGGSAIASLLPFSMREADRRMPSSGSCRASTRRRCHGHYDCALPPPAPPPTSILAARSFCLVEARAETGRALAAKFGKDAGLLYDAAIKSNLLLLLYEPGDDHGLGGVIRSRMSEAGLPEQLWIGVVEAIVGKASQSELKDAVLKMHEAVASYLAAEGE